MEYLLEMLRNWIVRECCFVAAEFVRQLFATMTRILLQNSCSISVFCDEIFFSAKPKAKTFCRKSLQKAPFSLQKFFIKIELEKLKHVV